MNNNRITLKGIIDEDFVNYKVPSMVLMFPNCTFKCGFDYCQNSELAKAASVAVSIQSLCDRYLQNDISKAVICQGLEPFDNFDEMLDLIYELRKRGVQDDVVIYTGYTKEELIDKGCLNYLRLFDNIVIKYGRYKPNDKPHLDPVLGFRLVSDNQYAERLV